MQSRVIILIHDDVGLVVLPAGMYHDVSRFRTLPAFKKNIETANESQFPAPHFHSAIE